MFLFSSRKIWAQWLVIVLIICKAAALIPQTRSPITEKIEWTWSDKPETPDAALPNVLLEGDSIARGYFQAVADDLKGIANVYLFATSAADDARLPTQLRDYFATIGVNFAVVHFNNGMHGWGYSESEYAMGLSPMIDAIRAGAPQAKLIWATTTPVRKDSMKEGPTDTRIQKRNAFAVAVMKREHIPIDDLYHLMLPYANSHTDDIHFNSEGEKIQAEQVSALIRKALTK
jgi:hypothetical protein